MIKIPCNVQSLLCASNQINNSKKAVEELVYNALDAGATSIAVRINIQENSIQVIDNGSGVSKKDFYSIGKKYMTSKFIDLSSLKSAPNKFGFRGQSLANFINISKNVKVISRHEKSEETLMKLFEYGKEKEIKVCKTRPSKGTTVQVNGFLYNLHIQKKSIDILSEVQSIKTFMEYLSIVHSNISLSLRDDSKNEIIFKMHKNRDIYQTLSTLYKVERKDFQELQVEKNEYKVTAFLGKSGHESGKHLIFLNGKFITTTSKLHKIVNKNLNKHMKLKGIKKPKDKNINKNNESYMFQKKVPEYFIFIKCPYMDYDLSTSPKQSVLEFKDWNQVNKLLDKLIQFFNGNMKLKEVNEAEKNKSIHKVKENETREQVKKIMEKILGTHSKKAGISHLHNGIKGKQVKRKCKKPKETTTTKMLNVKESNDESIKATGKDGNDDCFVNKKYSIMKTESNANKKETVMKYLKPNLKKSCLRIDIGKTYNSKFKKVTNVNGSVTIKKQPYKKLSVKTKNNFTYEDKIMRKFEMDTSSVKRRCKELNERTKELLNLRVNKRFCDNVKFNGITKSYINVAIRKEVDEIVIHDYDPKELKNKFAKNNVCKDVERIKFQSNYDLLQPILKSQIDSYVQKQIVDGTNNSYASIPMIANELPLQPRTTTREAYRPVNMGSNDILYMEPDKNSIEQMVTFQSHNYYGHQNFSTQSNRYHTSCRSNLQIETNDYHNFHQRPRTFITKESRDNFVIPNNSYKNNIFKRKSVQSGFSKQFKTNIKRLFDQTSKLFNLKKQILGNTGESSYTIEFTKSDSYKVTDHEFFRYSSESLINPRMDIEEKWSQSQNCNYSVHNNKNRFAINTNTYTVSNIDSNGYTIDDNTWKIYGTYTIEQTNKILNEIKAIDKDTTSKENCLNNRNIFISESLEHDQNEQIMDPINVCETILNSQEIVHREFEFSFNNMQSNKSNNYIENTDFQKRFNESLYGNFLTIENEKGQELNQELQPHHVEVINAQDSFQEVSHHFSLPNNSADINKVDFVNDWKNQSPILTSKFQNTCHNIAIEKQQIQAKADSESLKGLDLGDFKLKNRLCFVPKGMSPIFENCQTKNVCEYNLAEDYYENEIYDHFVDNVRNNADIFEPKIQDAKELTTKAIDKVNTKLKKDHSSLKFNAQSLKGATVLGQIDEKFIAVIMKGGCHNEAVTDFLVLFDQHAVHERIRLENNMSDYFNENQWKPINIDQIAMKMSNDDILYLHNYKDKFEQLGVQWIILNNNEVCFAAIPEAVLGKNPRQVETVIKALKNLITEEINIIKMQGGCVSLYPKSIMDLVFSEACRYAIKFGDKLSKSECVELLKMLSDCKTPFQCAHGRPVMAVIMDIKLNQLEYKGNLSKIMKWRRTL